MSWLVARFCVVLAILAIVLPAYAQYELITIERPFRAQSLSGVVVDPTGTPVAGVTVEERDPAYKSILSSTTTDAHGHFAFPTAKNGSKHYLHFASSGFDPMEISVTLRRLARAGVRIQMRVAS